jgi:hypothetical protein
MASSTARSTAEALTVVVRDFGRLVSTDSERLRGLLEDVLGSHARAERLNIDAVVAAAEHGVPAALLERDPDTPIVERELEGRLTANGIPDALAAYGVSTWMDVLGLVPAAVTEPGGDPVVPDRFVPDDLTLTPDEPPPPPAPVPPPSSAGRPLPPAPTILVDDETGAPLPAAERAPRHRRRWLVLAGVAALTVAVVAVVVAVQHRGGSPVAAVTTDSTTVATPPPTTTTTTSVAPTTTTTTPPVTAPFQPETTPWGASVGRTWAIENGTVTGTITLSNPGTAPISGAHVEVVPKSIAANRAALTLSVEPTAVLQDDPVLQFDVALNPGETKTITYQAPLAAGLTPSPELLAGWMGEWSQALAAFIASLDTTPPPLVIGAPTNDQTLESPGVIVTGSSEPGATVAVNGQPANMDPAGNWSVEMPLGEGDTTITVEAADAKGNKTSASVVVHYAPPETATTTRTTQKPRTPSNPGDGGTTTTAPPGGTGTPPPPIETTVPPDTAPAAPVARGDSYSWTAAIDASGNIYTRVLSVLGNDSGSGISITSAGGATHGSVSVSGGRIVYAPHHNGPFSDSFTYRITDVNGQTASASVSVSVSCNTSFQCYG